MTTQHVRIVHSLALKMFFQLRKFMWKTPQVGTTTGQVNKHLDTQVAELTFYDIETWRQYTLGKKLLPKSCIVWFPFVPPCHSNTGNSCDMMSKRSHILTWCTWTCCSQRNDFPTQEMGPSDEHMNVTKVKTLQCPRHDLKIWCRDIYIFFFFRISG